MNGFKMDGARPLPDCTYEMENVIPLDICLVVALLMRAECIYCSVHDVGALKTIYMVTRFYYSLTFATTFVQENASPNSLPVESGESI